MNTKRKSFVLHIDSLDILDELDNEQAGILFKAIKSFQKDEVIELDSILRMVFSPFKNQFRRDNDKYQITCERRAEAGSKGGKQKVANASKCKQKVANVADSVSKNKSDSDSKSDNNSESKVISRFAEFWDLYGKKVDRPKCEKKFSKLTSTEIVLLFTNLPLYIKSKPEKQYRKDPIRWLNGKCWNDEIIQTNKQAQSVHSFTEQKYTSGKF